MLKLLKTATEKHLLTEYQLQKHDGQKHIPRKYHAAHLALRQQSVRFTANLKLFGSLTSDRFC